MPHGTRKLPLLDAILADAVCGGVAPCAVGGVAGTDRILYLGAAGARRARDSRAVAVSDVFRIASMTKLVTSVAVMMLVEEGKVDLDAPFAAYVRDYRQPEVLESFDARTKRYSTRPAREAVTVRRLLAHTAGYGYWFLDAPLLALTAGVPALFDPPFLIHEPGARFAYSVSADVLGLLVEPVTGLALETFMRQRIFEPLGMLDSGYALPRDRERLVAVHARTPQGLEQVPIEQAGEAPRGGGGLCSTAGDYLRLLQLLLNGGGRGGRRLLSERSVAAIASNQIGGLDATRQRTALPARSNDFVFMDGSQKFGFGVAIETRDRPGGRSAGSYGWGGIYNTYFWVDPAAALAAVLLLQVSPFADPQCVELLARFERGVYETLRGYRG